MRSMVAYPTGARWSTLYYGEYVAPVDLFVGFDKFCTFDMPLIATGDEDLYFHGQPVTVPFRAAVAGDPVRPSLCPSWG